MRFYGTDQGRDVFERMTGTKHKGFKLHKKETPHNYIRLIIGTMLKLKKEGKT